MRDSTKTAAEFFACSANPTADWPCYSTRHAGATDFLKHGGDLVTLAAILGHTSTRMSEYYAHLAGNIGHLREAMNRANSFKK